MPEAQFLSIVDVATILGVSRWTVGRLLDDGMLPHVPVRGTPRIDRADLNTWIAEQKAASIKKAEKKAESTTTVEQKGKAIKRPGRPRKPSLPERRQ